MHFWDRRVSLKNNSVPTTSVFVGLGGAAIARGVRSPQKWLPTWIKKGIFSPCYERHESCLRDQCPSNFNTLGCGYSLFPLRDSRGKRTGRRFAGEREIAFGVETWRQPRSQGFSPFFIWLKKAKVLGTRLTWRACGARAKVAGRRKRLLRVLACCFGWTSP